jgi:hypothetical protein
LGWQTEQNRTDFVDDVGKKISSLILIDGIVETGGDGIVEYVRGGVENALRYVPQPTVKKDPDYLVPSGTGMEPLG